MNKRTTLALFSVLLLGIPSLNAFAQQEPPAHESGKTTGKDVQQDASKTARTIRSYSVEKRDEAARNAKTALDALDVRIAAIEKQIDRNWDKMNKSAREEARSTLQALHEQRIKAAEWYGALKNSNADAWEHMKQGFSDAYQSLQHALEKAQKSYQKDEKK